MKRIILSFVSVCFGLSLAAQTNLPGNCEVWLPKTLDTDVISKADAVKTTQSPYGQTPAPSQKHYWTVYSDRDNNDTYAEPRNGAAKFATLSFNEKLNIAVIKNGYALVYTEPKVERYPLISSAAVSRGWVPMSKLLLWQKGLADNAGISYKAVICANLNVGGSSSEGKLYKSPNGKAVDQLKTNMKFYFIMKEEGSKVLLGYYADLNNTQNGLYGWVDQNSFVPWNQRTCLEPTWDRSDVEYFAAKGKAWQVYAKKENMNGTAPAQDKFTTKPSNITGSYASEYKYRTMAGNRLRYPILEGSTRDLYYCSSFGTLGQKAEAISTDEDVRKAIQNLDATENINICFVVDGTSSMKPYFAAVKNAIAEGCKYFNSNEKIKVSVTIYRDKEDGDRIVESFPANGFTDPKNPNLQKFLDNAVAKSVAPDEKESLYYGIQKAVENCKFNPSQSNLMIIVGDCADNGKMGVKRDDIIKLLADKKVSLMAFQVRNKNNDAYLKFNTELTTIMKASLEKRYASQASRAGSSSSEATVAAVPMSDGSGWDIYNQNLNKNGKKLDIYRYVHRRNKVLNKDMDVKELSNMIASTIGDWNESIKNLRGIAAGVIDNGTFDPNNDGDGTLTAALIDLFGGDKDRFERIRKANALTSFRGWTYKQEASSKRSYYKVVVFFPAPELKNLVTKLEPLYQVARARSNERKPYYDAMVALAGTLVAQDKIKGSSYKAIMAKVFGLDSATTDLGGPTLEDILDPNVVSQQEYLNYVDKMKVSYERLRRILGEKYPMIFETAGSNDKYYWLPSEYLPL